MLPFAELMERCSQATQLRLGPLYDRATHEAGLTATDFYSIRDLLELSGLEQVESLHVLLLTMFAALNDGNPCVAMSPGSLALELADLAGDEATGWAEQIVADLDGGVLADLVGHTVRDNKPLVVHENGADRFLYFQRFLKHELTAWALLQERFNGTAAAAAEASTIRQALAEVLTPTGQPGSLNPGQRLALALALLRPAAIISGGPGTGKTSIIGSLLRCFVRIGFAPGRVALAAPTGRAAQRLTDAIHAGLARLPQGPAGPDNALRQAELKAGTLHQLLGYSPASGTFRHHQENPLTCDVVIVDEVSMVGLTLVAQLLRALPASARLVLLGDKDQLPSVEAGSWLAHLLPSAGRPSYSKALLVEIAAMVPGLALPAPAPGPSADMLAVLKENYRSEPRIQELAATINRQEARLVDQLAALVPVENDPQSAVRDSRVSRAVQAGGCWLLEPESTEPDWLRDVLGEWCDHLYRGGPDGQSFRDRALACVLPADPAGLATRADELGRLFAVVEGARILALVREGPWGAKGINEYLVQSLRPPGARGFLFPGVPVLLTRNDAARELFNGDVGLTLPTADGPPRVVFRRRDRFMALAAEALPAWEYAFAITVHKSQGSEYGQVLLVLPPEGARHLLTKELIYTGLTRARELAVVVATRQRLHEAVARKVRRTSGVIGPVAVNA